ncbi:unnamed protein product [Meloidogyne enterolobii]|uniref:Uncharacterized protein n=1 Tax=Meloidogyne enterolobii TaxID=390850 RepID=A0ACB1AKG5_MELEN
MGTERMAFLDAKMINDIYCPNACEGFGRNLRCQAGGYPDPNNCNVCKCPDGNFCVFIIFGWHLKEVKKILIYYKKIKKILFSKIALGGVECERLQPSVCGGELIATDQWQTLRSPELHAPEGSHIRFRLSDGESYVEIKHKLDIRLTGFRSCCYRPKEDTISDGSQIYIIFRPNGRTARFTLRFIRKI